MARVRDKTEATYRKRGRSLTSVWTSAIFSVVSVVLLGAIAGIAQGQSKADEYRVKAAFLFHFAQLVEWPSDAWGDDKQPLTLCTIGEDPFHGDLEATVEGKSIGSRPLRVQHFQRPQDIHGCHVLFVGVNERPRVSAIVAGLKDASVLTVGESDDFVQQGGMIGFCLENSKVRFYINVEPAERARLKISSRLLLLAKSVIGNRGGH